MYSMMEDSSDSIRSPKFKKLTQAICGLVSEDVKVVPVGCRRVLTSRSLRLVSRSMTTAW